MYAHLHVCIYMSMHICVCVHVCYSNRDCELVSVGDMGGVGKGEVPVM